MGNQNSYQKRIKEQKKEQDKKIMEAIELKNKIMREHKMDQIRRRDTESKYLQFHIPSLSKYKEDLDEFMKTYKVEFTQKIQTIKIDRNGILRYGERLGLYAVRRVYLPYLSKSIDFEIVEVTKGMVVTTNDRGVPLHSDIYNQVTGVNFQAYDVEESYTLLFSKNISPVKQNLINDGFHQSVKYIDNEYTTRKMLRLRMIEETEEKEPSAPYEETEEKEPSAPPSYESLFTDLNTSHQNQPNQPELRLKSHKRVRQTHQNYKKKAVPKKPTPKRVIINEVSQINRNNNQSYGFGHLANPASPLWMSFN